MCCSKGGLTLANPRGASVDDDAPQGRKGGAGAGGT